MGQAARVPDQTRHRNHGYRLPVAAPKSQPDVAAAGEAMGTAGPKRLRYAPSTHACMSRTRRRANRTTAFLAPAAGARSTRFRFLCPRRAGQSAPGHLRRGRGEPPKPTTPRLHHSSPLRCANDIKLQSRPPFSFGFYTIAFTFFISSPLLKPRIDLSVFINKSLNDGERWRVCRIDWICTRKTEMVS